MKRTAKKKTTPRQPGQHPSALDREDLLVVTERALIAGARTPAELLAVVPALGTWDTAKKYMREVRVSWRRRSEIDELDEARAEMTATIAEARRRAMAALDRAEKPAEVARLLREVERLVRCEGWLRGIDGDRPPADEPEPVRDPREWIPDEIEYLTEEMENAEEGGAYRDTLAVLIETLKEDLVAATDGAAIGDAVNPSLARMNPSNQMDGEGAEASGGAVGR